jgi:hypothetical protein
MLISTILSRLFSEQLLLEFATVCLVGVDSAITAGEAFRKVTIFIKVRRI